MYTNYKLRAMNRLLYHLQKFFCSYHLNKSYKPLNELGSVQLWNYLANYPRERGACKHTKLIKALQNQVCRTTLGQKNGISEAQIYPEMEVARLEELQNWINNLCTQK